MTEYTNISMYADDTVLYTTHTDPNTCLLASQDLFNQLYHWCSYNKMTIK